MTKCVDQDLLENRCEDQDLFLSPDLRINSHFSSSAKGQRTFRLFNRKRKTHKGPFPNLLLTSWASPNH